MMFGTRPKWTYADPEKYGYPGPRESRGKAGPMMRCCPVCWVTALLEESIQHKPGCGAEDG